MNLRNNQITVREVLRDPGAKALFQKEFPQLANNPMLMMMAKNMTLQQVIQRSNGVVPPQKVQELLTKLKEI